MAWVPGLAESYYLLATVLQVAVAALILATGRWGTIRGAFATLLLLNGSQTFILHQQLVAPIPELRYLLTPIDTGVLFTIAFLVSQFPTPLGGQRGHVLARRAWLAGLMLAPLALFWIHVAWGWPSLAHQVLRRIAHDGAFALATGLFALHLVPRWLELDPGPLRGQTLLAGAGLIMGPVFQAGRWTMQLVVGDPDVVRAPDAAMRAITGSSWAVTLWFTGAVLARLGWAAWRRRDVVAGTFLGLVTLGGVLGMRAYAAGVAGAAELAAQALRPLLLAGAMLRYDLFQLPHRLRRAAIPTALVFLAVMGFLLTVLSLSPESAQDDTVEAGLALGAVAGLSILFLAARQPLTRLLDGAGGPRADDQARLERYRLALERARAQGQQEAGTLARLRRELGVSQDEHRVLADLLARHVVLPTEAVRGLQPGALVADRYEVVRELGRGGFGRALLARDLEGQEQVVLKEVLRPWEEGAEDRRRALEREVEVGARLSIPQVAGVHGLVEAGYRAYLVREHVPGRTLDALVREEGPLTEEEAQPILTDIARGLAALHGEGLLHLDLKPANVVLSEDGRAVLIDQGTVRATERSAEPTAVTRGPQRTGTLQWMAPEQVLETEVDERTDLFALGAVAFHLLTGEHHLSRAGASVYEVETELVRGRPTRPTDGPLGEMTASLLARDPGQRPASANALLGDALDAGPREVLVSASEDEQAHADPDDVAR